MPDWLFALTVIAALIVIPCAVAWAVGRLTGTEGRGA